MMKRTFGRGESAALAVALPPMQRAITSRRSNFMAAAPTQFNLRLHFPHIDIVEQQRRATRDKSIAGFFDIEAAISDLQLHAVVGLYRNSVTHDFNLHRLPLAYGKFALGFAQDNC